MKKRVYIYLVYLVLISFVVTGVSLSRYSSSVAGSESAAAAKAVIDYVPVSMTLNGVLMTAGEDGLSVSDMEPGDRLIYYFNVNNFRGENINQVLMKYSISVVFDPAPLSIPVTYDVSPIGTDHYMGFGENETHSYTLTIVWDAAQNDPAYLNQQQDIKIQINAEQVDA